MTQINISPGERVDDVCLRLRIAHRIFVQRDSERNTACHRVRHYALHATNTARCSQ